MPKGPRGPKGIPDPEFPRPLPRHPRHPRRRFVPRRHHPEAHDGHRHTVNHHNINNVAGRRWNSEGHFMGLRQHCFRSGPNPGLTQPYSITVPAPAQRDILHNAPHSPISYTILCYIRILDHIACVDVTGQTPRYRMSSRRCGEAGFMGPNGPNVL